MWKGDTAYRPDIDGLRAVAIALVVIYHASHRWMPGGFVGVDVFFVISGYLITGILARGMEGGNFSFARFYSRRIRRIFPALFLVLVAVLAFGWFELLPPEYRSLGRHTAAGAGFLSNLALLQESGYFNPAAELKPLQHLWSLAVEEQFYIFWPLLLWIGRKRMRPAAMAGMVAALSFIFCVVLAAHHPDAAFYLRFSRAWELMAGGILALIPISLPTTAHRADFISLAGCLLIAAAAAFTVEDSFHVWSVVPPVAGAVLVILAGPAAWINRVPLSSSPAVLLGAISYPLYLWHWPILAFSHVLAPGGPARLERFLGVLVAVALAWLTWRYVERPIRESPLTSRQINFLAITAIAVGAAGLAVDVMDGVEARFRGERRIVAALSHYDYFGGGTEEDNWGKESCFVIHEGAEAFEKRGCATVRQPGKPLAMLIGDSHMAYLSVALKPALEARGFEALMLTASHCPIAGSTPTDKRCAAIHGYLTGKVADLKPELVVVFGNYEMDASASGVLKPSFAPELAAFVRSLVDSGSGNVLVVGQMPLWEPALPEFLARSYLRNSGSLRTRWRNAVMPLSLDVDSILRRENFGPRANYVSLRDLLCNSDGCLATVGPDPAKDLLVWDYGHLTSAGAGYVTERILPAMVRNSSGP